MAAPLGTVGATTVVFTLVLGYFLWYLVSLFLTYREAKKIGLPILVTPVYKESPLWLIFSVPLRPLLRRICPEDLYFRLEISTKGFESRVGLEAQKRLGPNWVVVSPGYYEIWTADSAVAKQVLGKWRDYHRQPNAKRMLGLFGQNIVSSDGEAWQRQRRVIAPSLNERISSVVWSESIQQAGQMIDHFTGLENPSTNDASVEGLRVCAINIIGTICYGKSRKWSLEQEAVPAGHQLSQIDSLMTILTNVAPAFLVPEWFLSLSIFPAKVRKIGAALREYPKYTAENLAVERKTARVDTKNLMSVIVKMSDQEKDNYASKSRLFLSEEEISGNLFAFTVAGFDTTANTMAYALALLAARPDLQDWIVEEIDQVAASNVDAKYEEVFPKLKRVLALMYETLRLFTPVPHTPRQVVGDQTIETSAGTKHVIAHNSIVFLSFAQAHIRTEMYGADSLDFNPSRWLSDDGQTLLEQPIKDLMAWSYGPRNCPGMKMSQVEFTSIFYTIFRRCSIEPVLKDGEILQDARARINDLIIDSQPIVTLQINRPKEVKLNWRRR